MDNRDFYKQLPILDYFNAITDQDNYHPLPDDWMIALTDVQGSTKAIENGLYKDVNLLGASSIMGILNAAKPMILPFVFGGDGATVCFPKCLLPKVKQSLLGIREIAEQSFNMKLRAGVVPVKDIIDQGYQVLVAKVRVSEHYNQSAFSGGGMQFADQCIKSNPEKYCLSESSENAEVDLTGLECRWNDIPSQYDEMIILLTQALGNKELQAKTYREVIEKIESIFGGDHDSHPVSPPSALNLALDKKKLMGETKLKTAHQSAFKKLIYLYKLRLNVIIGALFMRLGIKTGAVEWGRYKDDVITNTDYQKFDDMLRQILSATTPQRETLENYLEVMHKTGKLVYGIHIAPSVLMTCLIFERQDQHLHFVDGSNGGYAMAAKGLKKQLSALAV